ncbi:MarR family winged helix-turn-helix transcriptional regulator [uncultured Senegalimassilia sp.]|uniref:MarR family winged helix-turn-helix transcriptional regulator n=1 Tax=uncultured Senegalimassilia sp. TaxID=1714350 RepID=UPI0025DB0C42|nr:MarR family winged helix-turn-helix transcriptional regulator [uncultured Senegalimassilia sp.]
MDDTAAGLRRRLFNAAARMRKQRQEPAAPKGVTPAEMYAIMAVSRLEGEGRSVRSGDIAKCGHATPSAVSQTLKSLEEKGLITRQRDKGDSRAVTVRLTEEGRAFSARGRELHEQMIDKVLTYLGPEDAEHLVRIVERLADFPACKAAQEQQDGCAQAGSPAGDVDANPASDADAANAAAGDAAVNGPASAAGASLQAVSAEGGVPCA